MTEAYDGRQVVGMDLHRRRSVLVRMTEDGRFPGSGQGGTRFRSDGFLMFSCIATAGDLRSSSATVSPRVPTNCASQLCSAALLHQLVRRPISECLRAMPDRHASAPIA